MAISALVAYYSFDYGPNYMLGGSSQVVATGSTIYGQLGLLLPKFTNVGRWQPYVTLRIAVEALDGNLVQIGADSTTLSVGITPRSAWNSETKARLTEKALRRSLCRQWSSCKTYAEFVPNRQ